MALVNLTDVLYGEDKITIEDIVNMMSVAAEQTRISVKPNEPVTAGNAVAFNGYNLGEGAINVVLAHNMTGVSIGIADADIAVGEFGYIISNGVIEDIDTSGYNEGDILYISGSGNLVNIQPTAGYQQPIAFVLRKNANNGSILVDASYPKQIASDVRFDGTQTVEDELNLKAYIDSQTLTGTPEAPTKAVDTAGDGIATHDFVHAQIAEEAGTSIASLVGGIIPSGQLPSYVDDVLEYANLAAFPATGETGKIYLALDTNKGYRWSGTVYVFISSDLALGETSATAYRGDRGKTAYDHSQVAHAPANAEQNVNADWNASGTDAEILNKPIIPTVNNAIITLSPGTGITGGGDFTTDQAGNETLTFTHSDVSGFKHIPAGGVSGEYLVWSADGIAQWVNTSPSAPNRFNFFIPPGGSDTINVTYNPTNVSVSVDGIGVLYSDYTATNGTSIVFNTPLTEGTWVHVVSDGLPAANLAYNNSQNTFTEAQRGSIIVEDNIIDFTAGNNFSLTATAALMGTPTIAGCAGQSGVITIATAENITGWDALYKFRFLPSGLTGTERFAYFIESDTSIAIGLVQ